MLVLIIQSHVNYVPLVNVIQKDQPHTIIYYILLHRYIKCSVKMGFVGVCGGG